ncbi:aspartate--tRNA ligase [Ahrensia marina]|uniref:Aspartate--tRNA(Asp/Asn) ligase n=1 Tax=Ahrensia marina TaxID=1514904 RepID=A0A0N0VLZ2_9HYPH|nr:aspartate--tRNA ligase [Ahrensia marina]KPB01721.1 aspartyl-tRNA synthetase [Ahrensia marina]
MHRYRSHTCGALRKSDAGNIVRLSGWVHRVRDHGGVLFIDLRDHYGITQVVADPDSPCFNIAEMARGEWVLRIDGDVKPRSAETINANLPTGEIEVYARDIEVLSKADELPLPVFGEPDYPEDIRLKYRFLDLRRETLHSNIMQRTRIIAKMREEMNKIEFTEFSTPILTASSPEGARDFLVPSRIHPGQFYALPQAPQQYKQLIMMSGFDRYFQIAPCFRDEDPRADRLPGEFYQLDLEMSFVEQDEILETMEPVMRNVFEAFAGGKPVTQNFRRIAYDDAIRMYGSDKPDLRNPIVMQDVSEHFRGSGFGVFAGILDADPKHQVWAIPVKGAGSRKHCDRMNSWAQGEGQPGMGYIFWRELEGKFDAAGPIAKNIGEERTEALRQQLGLEIGDAVFFAAGDPKKFAAFAGSARQKAGEEAGLIDEDRFELCWIVDFPFYEWDEDNKRVEFAHNPFSMPQGGKEALDAATTEEQQLALKAYQYDLVCNGFEIASGGIRNHLPDTMVKAFEYAGLSKETVEERFGGLYRAFQYGAPPHGGMAAGVDRVVMLLVGAKNLREITMFPMNQQARDVLMGAPGEVGNEQLRELNLRINPIIKD